MRRVNSIIWEVLADEVHLLSDPRLDRVTITGVDTSPDLRRAVVFYSCADLQLLEEAGEGLNSAAGRLQGRLASQVRLKYTPRLDFRADQGVIGGQKIEKLLRGVPGPPVGSDL
jgi:ribosome-binding factor A